MQGSKMKMSGEPSIIGHQSLGWLSTLHREPLCSQRGTDLTACVLNVTKRSHHLLIGHDRSSNPTLVLDKEGLLGDCVLDVGIETEGFTER